MTALHITPRPFRGHEPQPPHDPATAAVEALAEARRSIATVPHPPGCTCCAWCRDDWHYAAHGAPALGACCACGELCRSIDPAGRLRHPTCEVGA